MTTAVSFQHVSRHFWSVRAVDDVSLDIAEGEFFAMLGPSGSGKTTCLRLIAGFEQPTSGHIEIFGDTAEGVPPYRRNVNTVFQDYALFPHMTVRRKCRLWPDDQGRGTTRRSRRPRRSSPAMVKFKGFERRRPSQLSGGQRQRVALARALVNQPKVLLLDEPLGALDLKLREQMQEELKALQKQLGITFVFVTHDQGEALSMANRVAIFNEGKIVQAGSPGRCLRAAPARASSPISSAPPTCCRRSFRGARAGRKRGPACGRRRSRSCVQGEALRRDGTACRSRSPPCNIRAP